MNKVLALMLCGAFAVAAVPASATENKQNTKMADCQAQATAKKLESKDRQNYVNECLKATPATPAKSPNKMAECNAKTKGMTKEDADKARSACMKG